MKSERLKESILVNTKIIQDLNARINETFKLRDRSPQDRQVHEQACRDFHSRYTALAFPDGYDGALERITSGDSNAVEAALCFLEGRPYFFRSGYMYKDILRKIKRASMSDAHAERLAKIVEAYEHYVAQRSLHA